ncbi:HEAT repeat domain-containing protein [Nostoc sp. UHCC 0702]|nr:HEAT repeat domain-containing protein [Nostoc sp. UHCC 0702]
MAKYTKLNFWNRIPYWLLASRIAVTMLGVVSPLAVASTGWAQTTNQLNVDQLIQNFKNDDLLERLNTVTTLGNLRDEVFIREALAKLKQALKDPDWRVRSGAALALSQKGGGAIKDTLPSLVENLNDPYIFVRSSAARAIGSIAGEDNSDGTGNISVEVARFAPYLINALQDPDFSVRINASVALVKLNSKSYLTVSRLITNLNNTDEPTRITTAQTLNTISRQAASVAPNIAKALQYREPSVRGLAIQTIGSIGTDTKVAMPYLIQGLQDPDWSVRNLSARTVAIIAGNLQEKARANVLTQSDVNAIPEMEVALQILQNPQKGFYNNERETVGLSINALKAARRRS